MNKVIQRDGKEQLVKREEPRRKRRVAKLWKVMRKIVTDTTISGCPVYGLPQTS